MVTRVTTPGNYATVLANLLSAQQTQIEAGNKVATQKNGQNLKDYAKSSELLTAMRTIQSRIDVYADQNKLLSDKLATQDASLVRVADAAEAVRQIFAEAVASGRADTLVEDVQAQLASAFQVKAKLDEATTINTGVLADDIGTAMLQAFKDFQTFNQGAQGPFGGALTDAQRQFLEGELQKWDTVRSDVTNLAAYNGSNQKRLETIAADLQTRGNSLASMMGDITDADMAQAAAELQTAQLSVQSAAYVFQALKESSLLNILK